MAGGNDPDNECNPGECNGAGACNQLQMGLANGSACVQSEQCVSGFCVNGICSASSPDCVSATYGGHTYRVCRGSYTNSAAQNECANAGMTLAFVDDKAENTFLVDTANQAYGCIDPSLTAFWVSNRKSSSPPTWSDGSPRWAPGEPSGDGDYVHLQRYCGVNRYGWNDVPPETSHGYICESTSVPVPDPEPTGCADLCTTKAILSGVGADRCLSVYNGNTSNGTDVESAICDGSAGQKWVLDSAGTLRSALGANICLDVQDGATAWGTPVRIWQCNGSPQQQWTRTDKGELRSALAPNLCLGVPGSSTTSGTNVHIWECDESSGEQWFEKPVLPNSNAVKPVPLAITINDVRINGGGNTLVGATPGQSVQVAVDYLIFQDTTCPGCIDQILIGIGASALGCVYNGGPSSSGTLGTGTLNIMAPAMKGVYYLRWRYGQDYSCAPIWWTEGVTPGHPQNIGVITVR